MLERLHQTAKEDVAYKKLADLVWEGIIRRYWLENDLLYVKGGRIYMPKRKLQKSLMLKTHDS